MRNRAPIVVQEQSLHQEIADSLQTIALEIDQAEMYAQAISLCAWFHYVLVIPDLGIPDADGVIIFADSDNWNSHWLCGLSTPERKKSAR